MNIITTLHKIIRVSHFGACQAIFILHSCTIEEKNAYYYERSESERDFSMVAF